MMRRYLLVLMLLGGGLCLFAPPAQAQSSCIDYLYDVNLYLKCAGGPTITVSPNATPGGPITVTLDAWLPGSSVAITIDCNGSPVSIGSVAIDGTGAGVGNLTVPPDCPLGPTTVNGTGPNMLDVQTTLQGPTVLASTATNTTLPVINPPITGSDTGRLVTIGAALVVIGAAALYGSRRARQAANY